MMCLFLLRNVEKLMVDATCLQDALLVYVPKDCRIYKKCHLVVPTLLTYNYCMQDVIQAYDTNFKKHITIDL